MGKTETSTAGKKAAYISPNIARFSVEYSLRTGSPSDGGYRNTKPNPDPLEPEDDEQW